MSVFKLLFVWYFVFFAATDLQPTEEPFVYYSIAGLSGPLFDGVKKSKILADGSIRIELGSEQTMCVNPGLAKSAQEIDVIIYTVFSKGPIDSFVPGETYELTLVKGKKWDGPTYTGSLDHPSCFSRSYFS